MITSRYTTVETELIHWLILIVVAVAMLLVLATALAADPMQPPMLPGGFERPAAPLARPFFPENPPLSDRAATEAAEKVWMTLEHQRAGCYAEALAGWEGVRLPLDTAVWKEIGMAAALVQMDDLAQALRRLEQAEKLAPHHPLVAYYRGLVWMRQAERLPVSMDPKRETPTATPAVERAVLELMAIGDLREAIDRTDVIDRAEPLVDLYPANGQGIAGPHVHDVLVALGVEHYVDDAQRHLFRLHLGRRELVPAEEHLNWAMKGGVAGTTEMRQLADAMLEEGQTSDALRVMHQAVKLDYPEMDRLCGWIQDWILARKPAGWLW